MTDATEELICWLMSLRGRSCEFHARQSNPLNRFAVAIMFQDAAERDRVFAALDGREDPSIERLMLMEGDAIFNARIRAVAWWGPRWASDWTQTALDGRRVRNMPEDGVIMAGGAS